MTRIENDLRHALRELERCADRQGAPFTADSIRNAATEVRLGRGSARRRSARWLAPLAAAAVVAAAAVSVVTLSNQHSGSSQPRNHQAAAPATSGHTTAHRAATATATHHPSTQPMPAGPGVAILDEAAAELEATSTWTAPSPKDFFYVRTTQATTWTSVSGTRAGDGRTSNGTKIWVSGCKDGHFVGGQSGTCSLNDVPRYLGDAPTAPQAWDAYLEQMAPGSRAGDAQGKIIVQVLKQDLTAPKAAAALLRYTASCPGLRTLAVRPVAGEKLIGVTCTSMTNGSYGLAFDATSHALAGFVVVTGSRQDGPAEIIRQTGVVPAVGSTP